jgi:hypothetical protein
LVKAADDTRDTIKFCVIMKIAVTLSVVATLAFPMFLTGCKKREARKEPVEVANWTSEQAAAADSVEGQLRSQKKRWVQTTREVIAGAYVQDILEGRLGQPKGRGAIGKVLSVSTGDNGVEAATVDFGRGYSVGINLSELSLVEIVPEDK